MQGALKFIVATAALLPLRCYAHWRLTKPVPRSGGAYENNPLPPSSNTEEEWVCRNPHPNPDVERPTLVAGSTTGIVYGTGSVAHVGDCAVYISYDTSRPRRTMRWVKIANLPDCRSQINQLVQIVVPSQLPAGDAVFRWDQYALHQVANVPPFIEWFIQCADINISSSSTRSWESFNSFSMIDNDGKPAYPSTVSTYRNPYRPSQAAPGDSGFWMTGPACVDDSLNQCAMTAVGTKGHTGFGGEDSSGSRAPVPSSEPTRLPSPMPTPPVPYPTLGPTPEASPSAGDAMCCYDSSCSTYGTSFCTAVGSWCSGSTEACETCGGTLCIESAGSHPVPVPSPPVPTPLPSSPTPAREAQCCYAGGCSSYATSSCNAVGSWCSGSVNACTSCGGTLCAGVSMLSKGHVRKQKFLHRHSGHALMQIATSSQKIIDIPWVGDLEEDEL